MDKILCFFLHSQHTHTPVILFFKDRQPPQELKRGNTKHSHQDFLVNYWSAGRQHYEWTGQQLKCFRQQNVCGSSSSTSLFFIHYKFTRIRNLITSQEQTGNVITVYIYKTTQITAQSVWAWWGLVPLPSKWVLNYRHVVSHEFLTPYEVDNQLPLLLLHPLSHPPGSVIRTACQPHSVLFCR